MIIPFIASIASAGNTIINRIALGKDKIKYKPYTAYSFLMIFLLMLLGLPLYYKYYPILFSGADLLLLFAMIIIATSSNLLIYYGLTHSKLTTFEPLISTAPLFTVLLAVGLYHDERNIVHIVAAIIAGIAVFVNSVEAKHLVLNKYSFAVLGGAFLMASENIILKALLMHADPLNIYFLRITGITIMLFLVFKPSLKEIFTDKKKFWHSTTANILALLQAIFVLWSFKVNGILITALVLNLIPVFVYLVSHFYLKEKMSTKNIICASIIFLAVIAVQIIQ